MTQGQGRILLHRNWCDQGLTHDAATLLFEKDNTRFNLALSKSSNFTTSSDNSWSGTSYISEYGHHKHIVLIFFTIEITDGLTFNFTDLMLLKQGKKSAQTVYGVNTMGGDLIFNKHNVYGSLTYYNQQGARVCIIANVDR